MEIVNPATGKTLKTLDAHKPEQVGAMVADARKAQGAWAAQGISERIAIIRQFGKNLEDNKEQFAKDLTREMGKPIQQALGEISANQQRIDFFLDTVPEVLETREVRVDVSSATTERLSREPLGVIGNISAWNYPYFVGTNVIVPALLCGNAVLYKPSEFALLTGHNLAQSLWDAGVPKDVFQLVVGDGSVGAALCDASIDGIFFTGSVATGRKIYQAAAKKLMTVQLELGGNDPVYVTEDVDLEKVVASVLDGAFYNAGQSCCGIERIYVHRSQHDAFVALAKEIAESYVLGDPLSESTQLGPLARRDHLAFLEQQMKDAEVKGAKVVAGGSASSQHYGVWNPTVIEGVNSEMDVMQTESFGPIAAIQPVASDAEAIKLMNASTYGLTAAVFCNEQARAERLLGQLHAGSVYWNCCDRVSPFLPWTGLRHSGVGSTLSEIGIEAFTVPKAWHLRAP